MNYHIHIAEAMKDLMECTLTQRYLNTGNYLKHHLPPFYTMIIKTNPTPKQIQTTNHKKVLFNNVFYGC